MISLTPRERPTPSAGAGPSDSAISQAEALFLEASSLDTGDGRAVERAETLYRQAIAADPYLIAALINLGNLHYSRGHLPEALALYEQAIALAPDYFEAHYNRANALHDAGRFDESCDGYAAALALDPAHADAHFYLAVTLEKTGRSADARPHWEAYQRLAPDGAWAALAREFTDS